MSYSHHQELPIEIAKKEKVKIENTEKKTLIKSIYGHDESFHICVQVQSSNKMVTVMLVNQRPIEKEVNYKSECTPIDTPESKFQGTLIYTLLNETSNYVNMMPCQSYSKSIGTLMSPPIFESNGTPMSTPNSEDDGTPISTPDSQPDCTPMGTPMAALMGHLTQR